jgi:hypothetical protein
MRKNFNKRSKVNSQKGYKIPWKWDIVEKTIREGSAL